MYAIHTLKFRVNGEDSHKMPHKGSLPNIPPMTRAERVRLQLAAEILAGNFRPGTRLDEVAQSSRMGVSRTPLREAVRQLVTLGLVENRPHRGVVVVEGVGRALFETLAELEAVCAALAADRMGPDQRTELAERAAGNGDWLALVHRGCGNAVLVGLAETLWQPLALGGLTIHDGVAPELRLALGQRAASAIIGGNHGAAQAAMRDYVTAAAEAFAAAMPQRRTG